MYWQLSFSTLRFLHSNSGSERMTNVQISISRNTGRTRESGRDAACCVLLSEPLNVVLPTSRRTILRLPSRIGFPSKDAACCVSTLDNLGKSRRPRKLVPDYPILFGLFGWFSTAGSEEKAQRDSTQKQP